MPPIASTASLLPARVPTSQPLLGLTILLVEDSRYFSDAVRLLSIRSGARMRRADCLASARKHLCSYRPDVVIVDMGLPDGSGLDFVAEVKKRPDAPAVIVISGVALADAKADALARGADSFMEKPFFDVASFQQSILSVAMDTDAKPSFVPRIAGTSVEPDIDALHEDLNQMAGILEDAKSAKSRDGMDYVAKSLRSVGRVSQDQELALTAKQLSSVLVAQSDWRSAADSLSNVVRLRLDKSA